MNSFGGATSHNSIFKAHKTSETVKLLPTDDFITLKKCRTLNFPHKTLSTLNFAAVNILKPNTRFILTNWKMDWPQIQSFSKWNYQSHPIQRLRTINTCKKYVSRNQWAHSKTLRWCNKKEVVLIIEAMRKNDYISPGQRYRYVRAWKYLTKPGRNLSTRIYRY